MLQIRRRHFHAHDCREITNTVSHLIARPLSGEQVRKAYTLARTLEPTLSMDAWERLTSVRGMTAGARVMSLQTTGGFVHALFICRQVEDPFRGRILEVDHVIAYDLPGRRSALQTLLRVAEQMARECACGEIDVTLPNPDETDVDWSQALHAMPPQVGYAARGIRWCKAVSGDAEDTGPAPTDGL